MPRQNQYFPFYFSHIYWHLRNLRAVRIKTMSGGLVSVTESGQVSPGIALINNQRFVGHKATFFFFFFLVVVVLDIPLLQYNTV